MGNSSKYDRNLKLFENTKKIRKLFIGNPKISIQPDTYLRLIRCYSDTRCPALPQALKSAFSDLGAALLSDLIPAPTPVDAVKWKTLFKVSKKMVCFTKSVRIILKSGFLNQKFSKLGLAKVGPGYDFGFSVHFR